MEEEKQAPGDHASPDDVLQQPSPLLDDAEERSKLADLVFDRIQKDAERPASFDEAYEQILALREETKSMDELISGCIAADAELQALASRDAYVRARNRLQQQHKRAREHLLAVIRDAVEAGALTVDEGGRAERWVGDLRRRQNKKPAASGKGKP